MASLLGVPLRRNISTLWVCVFNTAASSGSPDRHRSGFTYRHRHRDSSYRYVATSPVSLFISASTTAASSRSGHRRRPSRASLLGVPLRHASAACGSASSTRLPRAAVVTAIGLAPHVTIGIVPRRTTTSKHQQACGSAAATQLPRATAVIATTLALHVTIGIVARHTTTSQHQNSLYRHLLRLPRAAAVAIGLALLAIQASWLGVPLRCTISSLWQLVGVRLLHGCLEPQSSPPSTWLFTLRPASLPGVPSAAQRQQPLRVRGRLRHGCLELQFSCYRHRPGSSRHDRHRCSAYHCVATSAAPPGYVASQHQQRLLAHIHHTAASSCSRHRH